MKFAGALSLDGFQSRTVEPFAGLLARGTDRDHLGKISSGLIRLSFLSPCGRIPSIKRFPPPFVPVLKLP